MNILLESRWYPVNQFVYPHGRARNSLTDPKIIMIIIELNIFSASIEDKINMTYRIIYLQHQSHNTTDNDTNLISQMETKRILVSLVIHKLNNSYCIQDLYLLFINIIYFLLIKGTICRYVHKRSIIVLL